MVWLAIHTHYLPRIFPEANPVEEAYKDAERLLHPLQLGQADDSIVGIKVRCQVLYQQAKSLRALLRCLHHCHTMADHGIHSHIEERGGQGLFLVNSAVSLEWRSIVSSSPGHHDDPAPVRLEDTERPGANPIFRNNLKSFIPIQGVIRLLEVHKYLKKDRFPHGRELL